MRLAADGRVIAIAMLVILTIPTLGTARSNSSVSATTTPRTTTTTTKRKMRTTVYVAIPDMPPDDVTSKLVWTLNDRKLISPLLREESWPVVTKNYIYDQGCGFATLNPQSALQRVLLNILVAGRSTYNAIVAWFKLGHKCARPLYIRQYEGCNPRETLRTCSVASLPYWDTQFARMAFLLPDHLQLVIASPAKNLGGLYSRVMVVDNTIITSDVFLNVEKDCWFSDDTVDNPRRCLSLGYFEKGTIDSIGMNSYFHRPAHEASVEYLVRTYGGMIPAAYVDTTMKRGQDLSSHFWASYLTPEAYINDIATTTTSTSALEPGMDEHQPPLHHNDSVHAPDMSPGLYVVTTHPEEANPNESPPTSMPAFLRLAPTTIAYMTIGGLVLLSLVFGLIIYCIKKTNRISGSRGKHHRVPYRRLEDNFI
ncbi:envelope glycoprotein D [Falconid herpesvirus 1]|uniref:Envelope glycoprotein D n=1 Tax=Falconid herpesvirus 1 TaxID=1510155 RepID=A0A068EW59_9ALPH|nr:envelope glycoprotein D [Falconid herpesvirus 1]AID52799.1 envelope glycoprotein D [Falconid herpesvirus 1]